MNIIIEKGIPVPGASLWSREKSRVLSTMEVGDSFLLPDPSNSDLYNLRNAASRYGKMHRRRYAVRKVDGGYRCWRIT